MSTACNAITAIVLVVLAFGVYTLHELTKPLALPPVDVNQYWGPGPAAAHKPDTAIKPFRVDYADAIIADLRQQLNINNSLYHAELTDAAWHSHGLGKSDLLHLVNYWRDDYLEVWPRRQALLNEVPHFRTEIQGLNIHYVHLKPKVANGQRILPLLLMHGWPSSVREFYEIFPMLVAPDPQAPFAFEVIAPSLPAFGWSDGPAKVGFGPAEVAIVMRNLMLRIGHKRFYVQGGDWGSFTGSHLATMFPENVIGYHSNFCLPKTLRSVLKLMVASVWPAAFLDADVVGQMFPLADKGKLIARELGSYYIQATKPETLSAVLYHPVALAAYLHEKFLSAMPNSHDVNALLDNTMIYYLTQSFTSSARLYAEDVRAEQLAPILWRVPTAVPMGCTRFPNDIGQSLDWQLRDKYPNLVHSTWHLKGGHFAAAEVPRALYADFVEFVGKVEK